MRELRFSGRRIDALETLCGDLNGRGVIVAADLADRSQLTSLCAQAEEKAGAPIDILVNNAGMARDNISVRMSDAEWEKVIDVNLTSMFILTRNCLKGMMKRRYGRIVSIGSVVGTTGNPGQVNYSASKAGLVGMTKSLALELASRGITVNCVAPGFVDTAMTEALSDNQKTAIAQRIPTGRIGTPEDIAAAVLWLCSREAGYVTGQTVHVNGGLAMP